MCAKLIHFGSDGSLMRGAVGEGSGGFGSMVLDAIKTKVVLNLCRLRGNQYFLISVLHKK